MRANYLASPPLVVAYALAGRMDLDLTREPIGHVGTDGPVFLRDIWPSPQEVRTRSSAKRKDRVLQDAVRRRVQGDDEWRGLDVPTGETYAWAEDRPT